jgi:hypothetical protein
MASPKGYAPRDQWQRFTPGNSGNPYGRPRKNVRVSDIERAYQSMTPKNFAKWILRRSKHSERAQRVLLGMWRPGPGYKLPRFDWNL